MEGAVEKERRLAAGGWFAGVVETGANEPFFTPVGGWVVERGLPCLLSVSRTSGFQRLFFFLPFVPLVPRSRPLSLSLCLASVLFRARLSQPFYFAISFPRQRSFFLPFPTYMFAPFLLPLLASLVVSVSPPFTRALFRLLLRSVLRSDRLRIHCEIDRPKRVPEWPERTRMQQKGMGWHMRSGRFKGTPQERDATARSGAERRGGYPLHSDPVKLVQFFLDFPSGTMLLFLFARYILLFPGQIRK